MEFLIPGTWDDALAAKSEHPDALPLMGGTDVMVELNFDQRRPEVLLDLTRVEDLRAWSTDGERVRLGSGVTYAQVIDELSCELPGLAMASRTVGSPQIRNRGTIGGNLGAASPAGDSHPPLLATGAVVEVESLRGARQIAIEEFYTGVKQNALADDELIKAVLVGAVDGPQQFCKIGTRNAMVISVAAFGLALHPERHTLGTGVGSAATTPFRAEAAERFLADALDEQGLWESRGEIPETVAVEFGDRVRAAASPIDDVRGSAVYRLHALQVMARRAVAWAWDDYQKAA